MKLLGITDAAERLQMTPDATRRALMKAGVPLEKIGAKAYAVTEKDLQKFIDARAAAGYSGRGRPRGTFKPESVRSKAHAQKGGAA
jgi:hypothetical protein